MLHMQKMFSIVLPWWLWYHKLHNRYHQNLITLHTTSKLSILKNIVKRINGFTIKNNISILFKGNNTMVTYNKKIYSYIEFLASFEGYGRPWFQKLFPQSFREGNEVWVHDMSHSSICFIAYEALYFDSKRINIIDSIQNRKSSTKTIGLIICNHALQLRISLLCIQT